MIRHAQQRVPLGDAYWFQEGPGVRANQFRSEGVKLLNVSNITKDGQIDLRNTERHLSKAEVQDRYSHFMVDAGDLVIASSGVSIDRDGFLRTRGAFVRDVHLPLCMNTSTIRFKPIGTKSDLGYLRYWLSSVDFRRQITRLVTGTAQKNFGPSHLHAIQIPLPSLDEQRRIAAILDAADALRARRHATLSKLDTLAQSIFIDTFVRGEESNWPTKSVADISVQTRTGPFGSQLLHSEFTERGIAVLGIDNAVHNEFRWDQLRFIDEIKYRELQRYTVKPGDIIITIMGTCGRCAIIPDDIPLSINTKHLCCITPDREQVVSSFLHACLLYHPMVQRQMGVQEKGAVMPGLNMEIIRALRFPIPPLKFQKTFSVWTDYSNRTRVQAARHKAKLDLLFSSLQQRVFS